MIVRTPSSDRPIGDLLREWRTRRRRSQLDLALAAEISTKHLSFLETGRASPSREMVLNLAECLEVPFRERNALLHAAGFAPAFPERPLADPALDDARIAVELVLKGHEPFPAIAIDRHWTLIAANAAAPLLLTGVDAELLVPPVNVLRVSLHPRGLAPHIANLAQWRAHVLARLRQQIAATADPVLESLYTELESYAPATAGRPSPHLELAGIVLPLQFVTDRGVLSFLSTTTVFGTPIDITLSELAIESFFPADRNTADQLALYAQSGATSGASQQLAPGRL